MPRPPLIARFPDFPDRSPSTREQLAEVMWTWGRRRARS